MNATNFPHPLLTSTTRPFWDGLRERKLLAFRCKECGAWYWPYSGCVRHENKPYLDNMEWQVTGGQGTVFTFNIHEQRFSPVFPPPYIYGIVELDEGPLISTSIIGVDPVPGSIRVGDRVRAVFHEVDSQLTVLRFEPVSK